MSTIHSNLIQSSQFFSWEYSTVCYVTCSYNIYTMWVLTLVQSEYRVLSPPLTSTSYMGRRVHNQCTRYQKKAKSPLLWMTSKTSRKHMRSSMAWCKEVVPREGIYFLSFHVHIQYHKFVNGRSYLLYRVSTVFFYCSDRHVYRVPWYLFKHC